MKRPFPLKILALSHAGVLEVNRAIFQAVGKLPGFEVRMIVPETWKGDLIRTLRFRHASTDDSIRVASLPSVLTGNGSLFFYRKRLRNAYQGWRPDLIFLDEEPWSLAALQTFVEFADVPIAFFTKQNLKKKVPFPFDRIQRWVFERARFAYSVADEVTEVLRWKSFSRPIVYLPHSFDPAIFHSLPPEQVRDCRRRLGIPEEAVVFGYFGRLTEEKGLQELMTAARQCIEQRKPSAPVAHFLCVGNGPLAEKIRKSLKEFPAGTATFLPAIPHDRVGETLAAIDVLVLPSRTTKRWKEQFGRILVEAMACGAAVLGSDSGEIPHLIRRAGGGAVFHERDAEDLLGHMTEVLENPETLSNYRKAGNAYVHEQLTHEAVAKSLAKSFLEAPLTESRD